MEENNGNMNYATALAELEEIVRGLQSESCDVDTLIERTRRAAELLTFCRNRLTATDQELRAILDSLSE